MSHDSFQHTSSQNPRVEHRRDVVGDDPIDVDDVSVAPGSDEIDAICLDFGLLLPLALNDIHLKRCGHAMKKCAIGKSYKHIQ